MANDIKIGEGKRSLVIFFLAKKIEKVYAKKKIALKMKTRVSFVSFSNCN